MEFDMIQASYVLLQGCHPWGCRGILEGQLILSQLGWADYAHQKILAPLDFQTFLRPCIVHYLLICKYNSSHQSTLKFQIIVKGPTEWKKFQCLITYNCTRWKISLTFIGSYKSADRYMILKVCKAWFNSSSQAAVQIRELIKKIFLIYQN